MLQEYVISTPYFLFHSSKIYCGGLLFAYNLITNCSCLYSLLILPPILIIILWVPTVPITISIILLIVAGLPVASLSITFPTATPLLLATSPATLLIPGRRLCSRPTSLLASPASRRR